MIFFNFSKTLFAGRLNAFSTPTTRIMTTPCISCVNKNILNVWWTLFVVKIIHSSWDVQENKFTNNTHPNYRDDCNICLQHFSQNNLSKHLNMQIPIFLSKQLRYFNINHAFYLLNEHFANCCVFQFRHRNCCSFRGHSIRILRMHLCILIWE